MATGTIGLSGELERRIKDALTPLHPEKVILFGAYAWGRPTPDIDIDLCLVTQDDFMPSGEAVGPFQRRGGGTGSLVKQGAAIPDSFDTVSSFRYAEDAIWSDGVMAGRGRPLLLRHHPCFYATYSTEGGAENPEREESCQKIRT